MLFNIPWKHDLLLPKHLVTIVKSVVLCVQGTYVQMYLVDVVGFWISVLPPVWYRNSLKKFSLASWHFLCPDLLIQTCWPHLWKLYQYSETFPSAVYLSNIVISTSTCHKVHVWSKQTTKKEELYKWGSLFFLKQTCLLWLNQVRRISFVV